MTTREPGYYWVMIGEWGPIIAEWVRCLPSEPPPPRPMWWETMGTEETYDDEEVTVLSARLRSPTVGAVLPATVPGEVRLKSLPTINQVMNHLSLLGCARLLELSQVMDTTEEVIEPHIERLMKLGIVQRNEAGWMVLVMVNCEHDFRSARNCVKCGKSKEMLSVKKEGEI